MKKTIITLNASPKGQNSLQNFSELNFKEVDIWKNKIAWTFFTVNLNEECGQLWSRDCPSSFLIKTESGNIYKVFQPSYGELSALIGENNTACQEILSRPTERCLFNPKTRKIVGIENPTIRCGEQFAYAPNCITSKVKEIVGIASSQGSREGKGHFTSSIDQDFSQQKKRKS